jgi:hypothetical protein
VVEPTRPAALQTSQAVRLAARTLLQQQQHQTATDGYVSFENPLECLHCPRRSTWLSPPALCRSPRDRHGRILARVMDRGGGGGVIVVRAAAEAAAAQQNGGSLVSVSQSAFDYQTRDRCGAAVMSRPPSPHSKTRVIIISSCCLCCRSEKNVSILKLCPPLFKLP